MNKSMLFLCVPLFACAGDKADDSGNSAADPLELEGTQWLLNNSEGFEPVDNEALRLNFFEVADEGVRFSMGTGCNIIGGTLLVEDGKANISSTGMSMMACDMPLHEQENWLYDFAMSTPDIAKSGDNLILTGTDATLTYIDEELAVPDLPLADTSWTVESYIDGENMDMFNLESHPTLTFNADGSMGMTTGCNSCSGTYEVDAASSTLSVSPMDCSLMECMDDLIQEVETHMNAVFSGNLLSFEIDATRLTVMNGDLGVSAVGQ